jgi:hypothetical protein
MDDDFGARCEGGPEAFDFDQFDDVRGRRRDRPTRARTPDTPYPLDVTFGQENADVASSRTSMSGLDSSARSEAAAPLAQLHGEVRAAARERLVATWDTLGAAKWKEWIDGKYAQFGPRVFDDCLHRGNFGHPEDGYLDSITRADALVASLLGTRTTVETFLRVHEVAMSHIGGGLGGQMRCADRGNRINIHSRLEPFPEDVEREINAMRPKICTFFRTRKRADGVHDTDSSYDYELDYPSSRVHFVAMKRKRRRRYLAHYLRRFYRRIRAAHRQWGTAVTSTSDILDAVGDGDGNGDGDGEGEGAAVVPDGGGGDGGGGGPRANPRRARAEIVAACAWLQQVFQRTEPCPDGNQRVAVLLTNKHLTEFGLHPTILDWPGEADVTTHATWASRIEEGLRAWERQRRGENDDRDKELGITTEKP